MPSARKLSRIFDVFGRQENRAVAVFGRFGTCFDCKSVDMIPQGRLFGGIRNRELCQGANIE